MKLKGKVFVKVQDALNWMKTDKQTTQCKMGRKKQSGTDRETEMAKDSGHCSKPDYDWMWIRFPNRWSRSETVRCISQQWGEEEGGERRAWVGERGRPGGWEDVSTAACGRSKRAVVKFIYSGINFVLQFYSVMFGEWCFRSTYFPTYSIGDITWWYTEVKVVNWVNFYQSLHSYMKYYYSTYVMLNVISLFPDVLFVEYWIKNWNVHWGRCLLRIDFLHFHSCCGLLYIFWLCFSPSPYDG